MKERSGPRRAASTIPAPTKTNETVHAGCRGDHPRGREQDRDGEQHHLRVSRDPAVAARQLVEQLGGAVLAHRFLLRVAAALNQGRRP
jgi:hypothetical protein